LSGPKEPDRTGSAEKKDRRWERGKRGSRGGEKGGFKTSGHTKTELGKRGFGAGKVLQKTANLADADRGRRGKELKRRGDTEGPRLLPRTMRPPNARRGHGPSGIPALGGKTSYISGLS